MRTDAQSAAIHVNDAPIWMLYQAYIAASGQDGPYVLTKSMRDIRSIVRESILSSTVQEVVPLPPPSMEEQTTPPLEESQPNSVEEPVEDDETDMFVPTSSVFDEDPPSNSNAGGLLGEPESE